MKKQILKCPLCNEYTLKEICIYCSKTAITPKPAKYSVEDRFGGYRRKAKKNGKI